MPVYAAKKKKKKKKQARLSTRTIPRVIGDDGRYVPGVVLAKKDVICGCRFKPVLWLAAMQRAWSMQH